MHLVFVVFDVWINLLMEQLYFRFITLNNNTPHLNI